MSFTAAFGTDDGKDLTSDHFGMAKIYHVYEFSGDGAKLVEQRENSHFAGDETMKHGDPKKAKATSSVLQGVDVLVGKRFGPNLPRLLGKFVCVLVRTNAVASAVEAVHGNLDRIEEQRSKEEGRKHIVLKP